MDLTSRFLVLARIKGGLHFDAANAGDSIETANRAYLDCVASAGTTDVVLCERVPVIIHDGRGATGRMAVLAERLGWCQRRMLEAGLSADDVARRTDVRFSADSILKMFTGEEIKARWVDDLTRAVQALTRHLDPPATTDGETP